MFESERMALDFGAYSIKAVLGHDGGGKFFLRDFFEIPLPEPTDFLNKESFSNSLSILKTGLSRMGIATRGRGVYIALDGSLAFTRKLVLPYVKEPELTPLVNYEIENYLSSLPIENEIRFYIEEVFKDADGVAKMKIFASALNKNILDMTYDGLKSLGFIPLGLDLNSNCVGRVHSKGLKMNGAEKYKKPETCAYMDIGYKKICIDVFYKDYLDLNRVTNHGSVDLDSVIMDILQITREELEFKKRHVLNLDSEKKLDESQMEDVIVNDISKDVIDNWISQLQKVIRYYTSKDVGHPIEHVYLHGGSSAIKGLEAYMAETIGLPVTKVKTFANIIYNKNLDGGSVAKYLNAIGALLHKGGRSIV